MNKKDFNDFLKTNNISHAYLLSYETDIIVESTKTLLGYKNSEIPYQFHQIAKTNKFNFFLHRKFQHDIRSVLNGTTTLATLINMELENDPSISQELKEQGKLLESNVTEILLYLTQFNNDNSIDAIDSNQKLNFKDMLLYYCLPYIDYIIIDANTDIYVSECYENMKCVIFFIMNAKINKFYIGYKNDMITIKSLDNFETIFTLHLNKI